jgi:acyl-coenzyme A synthetase/AMP-(fatty) acid ligase
MSDDQIANYEQAYRDFRWDTPEYFNFGSVVDGFAADPNRVAIRWEDQEGRRARLTFADIAEQSNRIANVLVDLGIQPGEPIMLVLPRITLWQAAYIGALKMGALVIPCTAMLREKDLVYRANHSGARAIIAGVESAAMVADLRKQCPTLTHYLLAGAAFLSRPPCVQSRGGDFNPFDSFQEGRSHGRPSSRKPPRTGR